MKNMEFEYDIAAYDYILPVEQIAQLPADQRDHSRLLQLDCRTDKTADSNFTDILDLLEPGDLLVVNNTKVFPARLEGKKTSGGKIEFFLLEYPDFSQLLPDDNEVDSGTPKSRWYGVTVTGLLKSSKRPKPGARISFSNNLMGNVLEFLPEGKVKINLLFDCSGGLAAEDILARCGRIPLPPYIRRSDGDHESDSERYQTLFASNIGAVAAPTAGLHFSATLLDRLQEKNIDIASITLHVGYGTFAPVRVKDIRNHEIHEEYVEVPAKTAEHINRTRSAGNRIWAVGTTTVRSLEYAASAEGIVEATSGWCSLYIYPGYKFKVVNSVITNFHLPGSSLLFLVAALAGRMRILRAYEEAIRLGYRFYSYGDAMAIITE
jgi:S-adenosylmethionine:tRNA ribosyltransferase-isomerase